VNVPFRPGTRKHLMFAPKCSLCVGVAPSFGIFGQEGHDWCALSPGSIELKIGYRSLVDASKKSG